MNGKISVSSEEGKGSTFTFTAVFETEENSKTIKTSVRPLDGINVLIVDDNLSNLKIASYYLNDAGCNVYNANSSEKALLVLKSTPLIEVIILDHQMPNTDGLTLASKIKSIPEFSNIPLVLITSLAQKGEGQKAKDHGITGYLTKPIRKSDMLECVAIATEVSSNECVNKDIFITKHTIKESNFISKHKILLVEDNEMNQKLSIKILNKAGFTCDVAFNGKEAVESYQNNIYDLILMDCQMPILDGYEATSEIRAIEATKEIIDGEVNHIPIIALTAHSLKGDIDKCLSFGMDDYLSKPINDKTFIATIKKYLPVEKIEEKQVLINSIISEVVDNIGFTEEEAKEFLNEYIKTIPKFIKAINQAIVEDNFKEISSQAHLMKGSSANLRIKELTKMSLSLEKAAKEEDVFLCEMLTKEIKDYVDYYLTK